VRDRAKPFLVTGGLIIVEVLALVFANEFPVLKRFDTLIGHGPGAPIWLMGFTIGALTSLAGWQAGKRPTVPIGVAAVPA
jgi:hypothetical protein